MSIFTNKFGKLSFCLITILFFFSCQKNLDFVAIDSQGPDLVTKVTSSVSGFVTDENNIAVQGAEVKAGGHTANTDKYGFFEIKNIQVVKNAAVVVVTNPGYFKGIKTYIAADNKAAFFRIKLIPKTNSGTINAASGGNVTLSNGLIVSLPANAVINASSNAAYTGVINVASHWIDPTATDLNQTMPGDLRGIATDGSLKTLTTYGMAAVELTGASGELLQIAPDKKATLTFNIPAAIAGTAPATIPLWSFDETTGLWKQEGTATKTGNTYVGEVSHFSFWNCDVPANYVWFDCTVVNEAGSPIPYAIVKISVVGSGPYNYRTGWTDSSGYVSGQIPDNAQLLLEIFTNTNCGAPVYTQNLTTSNTNISLGNITVGTAMGIANVSGSVTNCSAAPVTNGYLMVLENGQYTRYALSNTGTFNFARMLCNNMANVSLLAEDLDAAQQSTLLPMTLVTGPNVIGNLQACGVSISEFINYTIDGTPTVNLTAPADSIAQSPNGTNFSNITGYSPTTNNSIYFSFDNTGIGVGTTQPLEYIIASQLNNGNGTTTSAGVNITEYGPVGQFISGNFTANVVDSSSNTHTIVSNFRVRRSF